MRGRLGWIKFDSSPILFVVSLIGMMAATIILIIILYLLYYHERYVALIANRIWDSYKKLNNPRL
jgi:hypothetical protein